MPRASRGRATEPTRRDFLKAAGVAATGTAVAAPALERPAAAAASSAPAPSAVVRGAFLYPPTETLRQAGYWSWPGATFNAEGREREYRATLGTIERELGIALRMDEAPLDGAESVARFIRSVAEEKPDGLLLIPFKKSHWTQVTTIVKETGLPTVILATLGILLVDHIRQLHRTPGVYLINSLDNLEAVACGLRMLRTGRRMRDSRILNIAGRAPREPAVPHLGTRIQTIPGERFIEEFNRVEATGDAKALAESYRAGAQAILQPSGADIQDAARTYFALKRVLAAEGANALMMDCLPGLSLPHRHPPPCMGFMSLRDEGIPAGCQSDLSATLTLMLVQELFGKPGFQQNASMETERNHYFGAHCTCPTRLGGPASDPEPYVLMSHAEAGWGCVPRVLWRPGQKVTMAQYVPGEAPRMLLYGGTVVGCPDIARTGGCRTNLELAIDGVPDACEVKGMHQVVFAGEHVRELRRFCQLFAIPVDA